METVTDQRLPGVSGTEQGQDLDRTGLTGWGGETRRCDTGTAGAVWSLCVETPRLSRTRSDPWCELWSRVTAGSLLVLRRESVHPTHERCSQWGVKGGGCRGGICLLFSAQCFYKPKAF